MNFIKIAITFYKPNGAGLISISFDNGNGGGGINGMAELIPAVNNVGTSGGGGKFIKGGAGFIKGDKTLQSVIFPS